MISSLWYWESKLQTQQKTKFESEMIESATKTMRFITDLRSIKIPPIRFIIDSEIFFFLLLKYRNNETLSSYFTDWEQLERILEHNSNEWMRKSYEKKRNLWLIRTRAPIVVYRVSSLRFRNRTIVAPWTHKSHLSSSSSSRIRRFAPPSSYPYDRRETTRERLWEEGLLFE